MSEGSGPAGGGKGPAGEPEASRAANPSTAVFVSYATQDTALANAVVQTLERNGVPCWIAPRDVTPGSHYADAIMVAISGAKALVVILSKDALASKHVGKEIERASSKGRPIIALRTDSVPLTPAFEYFLSESQWIEVGAGGIPAVAAKLIQAARLHLDPTAAAKPTHHHPIPIASRTAVELRNRWAIIAAIVIVGVALGWFLTNKFWSSSHVPESKKALGTADPSAAISDKSIAVLPFVDMSEKKDQEYFADGMAEEILDRLAKLPGLSVIGRTSSFQFKGKTDDLRKIGSALGAAYVVEGSVRKSGDRLRITAQLIESHDGSHVWSDTYDDTMDDVLKVQDRISIALVRALQLTVGANDLQSPTIKNAQAYDLYLRGQHALDRGSDAALESAIGYFQQALQLDPSFIRAAEWIAFAHLWRANSNWIPARVGYEQARTSAQRGLALDPKSAALHSVMAAIHGQYDWDWRAAQEEARRALTLSPRELMVIETAGGVFFDAGQWDEAARLDEAALAIDPLDWGVHWNLAVVRIRTGRFPEAEEGFRKALEISPTSGILHSNLGWTLLYEGKLEEALAEMRKEPTDLRDWGPALVYYRMGRKAESDAALGKYTKEHADDDPYGIADIHAYRGETDEAFSWLDRAYKQRQAWLYYVRGNPDFKTIERDPRYKAFLRKLNLTE